MASPQSIRVSCRVRGKADDKKERPYYSLVDDRTILHQSSGKAYTFDRLFSEDASQHEVYNDVAKPIVANVFNGYNGTIMTYGQTSSGKTFTMEGDILDSERYGIIPRAARDIFSRAGCSESSIKYEIKISFYEIYMEKIRDLFNESQKGSLKVFDDKKSLPFIVGGKEICVKNVDEILALFKNAKLKRKVAATDMNELSSRSHTIFQIIVKQEDSISSKKLLGKLLLVDLAGSEKTTQKNQSDATLKRESTHINKSLFSLTKVISLLSEGKKDVIPYRESILTRLLKESLGGNSQTAIVVCIDPSFEIETKLSLEFGSRAKKIENNLFPNEKRSKSRLSQFWGRFLPKKDIYLKGSISELKRWRNGETVPIDEWVPLYDGKESISDSSSLLDVSDSVCSTDQTDNSQLLSDSSLMNIDQGQPIDIQFIQAEGEEEFQKVEALQEELAKTKDELAEVKRMLEYYSHLDAMYKEAENACYLLSQTSEQLLEELRATHHRNKILEEHINACNCSPDVSERFLMKESNTECHEAVADEPQHILIEGNPSDESSFVEDGGNSAFQHSWRFLYNQVLNELQSLYVKKYGIPFEDAAVENKKDNEYSPHQLTLHEELFLYFAKKRKIQSEESAIENEEDSELLRHQLSLYRDVLDELHSYFAKKYEIASADTAFENDNSTNLPPSQLSLYRKVMEELHSYFEDTLNKGKYKRSPHQISLHKKLIKELLTYFDDRHKNWPKTVNEKENSSVQQSSMKTHVALPNDSAVENIYELLPRRVTLPNKMVGDLPSFSSDRTLTAINSNDLQSHPFIQEDMDKDRRKKAEEIKPIGYEQAKRRSVLSEKNWFEDLGVRWSPELNDELRRIHLSTQNLVEADQQEKCIQGRNIDSGKIVESIFNNPLFCFNNQNQDWMNAAIRTEGNNPECCSEAYLDQYRKMSIWHEEIPLDKNDEVNISKYVVLYPIFKKLFGDNKPEDAESETDEDKEDRQLTPLEAILRKQEMLAELALAEPDQCQTFSNNFDSVTGASGETIVKLITGKSLEKSAPISMSVWRPSSQNWMADTALEFKEDCTYFVEESAPCDNPLNELNYELVTEKSHINSIDTVEDTVSDYMSLNVMKMQQSTEELVRNNIDLEDKFFSGGLPSENSGVFSWLAEVPAEFHCDSTDIKEENVPFIGMNAELVKKELLHNIESGYINTPSDMPLFAMETEPVSEGQNIPVTDVLNTDVTEDFEEFFLFSGVPVSFIIMHLIIIYFILCFVSSLLSYF